ncbi:DUF2953 domain-containing protein [Lutispora sp.]|uniref:DUF2953 domain-containing protein n=1 Tax=Lutispora sp. TaxID=2828727 RepID=UPI0035644A2A
MFFIWITIALFVMSFAIYHAHLRLSITYKKLNNNDIIIVQLSTFYGIINYSIEMPVLDFINKMDSYIIKFKLGNKRRRKIKYKFNFKRPKTIGEFFDMLVNFINKYKLHKESADYIIKKTYTKDLSIKIEYGLNDAYITAICYGLFYILITNIIIYMQSHMSLQVKDIILKPFFNKEVFNLEFNCIIGIKIGHIISALKMFIKTSRGSEIDGTAYRRPYENNYGKY